MPKLSQNLVQNVASAETMGEFELLKPGKYLSRLYDVEVKEHPNYPNNVVVWNASFNRVHSLDGTSAPGRQFYRMNVILNDHMPPTYPRGEEKWAQFVRISNGQLKSFFENMGFSVDSDTDEMIGEPALLDVAIRTIQSGARQGEQVNEVRGVRPLPSDIDPTDILGETVISTDAF